MLNILFFSKNNYSKGVCMERGMHCLMSLVVCCLFTGILLANEVVLQNGLNGYEGCQDTWMLRYAKDGLVMQEYMPDRFDVYSDTCLA